MDLARTVQDQRAPQSRPGIPRVNMERLARLRISVGPILGGEVPSDPHQVANFAVRYLSETPGIGPHLPKVEEFRDEVSRLNGSLKPEFLKFRIRDLIDSISGR